MTDTVLAAVSDLHCGSTVGLHPDTATPLDDGGSYAPTRAQCWLWTCWRDYWATVARASAGKSLVILLNGDLVDGDHHGTAQIVTRHPGVQFDVLARALEVPLALGPSAVIVVRGTESHVGTSGAVEEAVAKALQAQGHPIVPCPDTHTRSWWHFTGDLGPLRVSATHHGRIGQRPWTRGNVSNNLAAQIFYEHAARGERHPDLALRSHYHKVADSGDSHPTRVIQTPAWQLATAYAHRVAADSLADIGGLIVDVDAESWMIQKKLYRPQAVTPWRMA